MNLPWKRRWRGPDLRHSRKKAQKGDEAALTYSIIWVALENPLLLISDGFGGEAEGPQSPANVVPRSQRHVSPLAVEHERGQEGHKYPQGCGTHQEKQGRCKCYTNTTKCEAERERRRNAKKSLNNLLKHSTQFGA